MYMDFGRRKQFPVRNDSAQTWRLIAMDGLAEQKQQQQAQVEFSPENAVGQGSSPAAATSALKSTAVAETVPDAALQLEKSLAERLEKIEAALGLKATAATATATAAAAPSSPATASAKTKTSRGKTQRAGKSKAHASITSARKATRPNRSYYQKMNRERQSIERSRTKRRMWDEKRKEAKRNANRLAKVKVQSRELPDSWVAFDVDKPAFAPYGNGNVAPVDKGTFRGGHMLSQNLNPQREPNSPSKRQVTSNVQRALNEGRYRKGTGQKSGFHANCALDPFAETPTDRTGFENTMAPPFPALNEGKAPNTPNVATTSNTKVDLEALLAKEKELLEREKQLLAREKELMSQGSSAAESSSSSSSSASSSSSSSSSTAAASSTVAPPCRQAWGRSRNLNSCPATFQWVTNDVKAQKKEPLQPASAQNAAHQQHIDLAWCGNNPTRAHRGVRVSGQ